MKHVLLAKMLVFPEGKRGIEVKKRPEKERKRMKHSHQMRIFCPISQIIQVIIQQINADGNHPYRQYSVGQRLVSLREEQYRKEKRQKYTDNEYSAH